jgi:hypothetical protein
MRRFSGRLSTCPRYRRLCAVLALGLIVPSLPAVANDANSADQQRVAAIEAKLDELNEALSQTEKMLEKSRAEIQSLHFAHKPRLHLPKPQPRIRRMQTPAPRGAKSWMRCASNRTRCRRRSNNMIKPR